MPFETRLSQESHTERAMLGAIIDTAGNIILGLRPDHAIFAWNAAAERLYQTPRHKAIGMDYVTTFVAPESRDAVAIDIAEVLAGKRTLNYENGLLLPDGTRRTLLWNVARLVDEQGTATGIVATGQDITARKEAEERFRLVFEHALDGLLLTDTTGAVIDCNPAALRMLGLRFKAELIGRRPAEFSPARQPDGTPSEQKSREFGAITLERGAHTFEWLHQRADGTPVPVEVSVRHATLSGRRVSVVSWRDHSRREELARERSEMEQRLNLAQKMEAVGQLAGGVAHDFNNLLAAIRNSIQLAVNEMPPEFSLRGDLELALQTTERAAGLTGQLLAFSRRQTRPTEPVDVVRLVAEVLPLLRTSLPPSIDVQVHAASTPAIVLADRSQLEQVVLNLVLNARDAMPGGGTLSLAVTLDAATAQVHLSVADTGVGMDAAVCARVFEPFFTTKPVGTGTGLGLAVVYGVVTQSGGTVRVESAPGQGTTFHITLPARPGAAAPTAPPAAIDAGPLPATVLLVDDDTAVRSTTRRLLSRQEFTVIEAQNGHDALERFRAEGEHIAVVLTDIRMPVMDGVTLAQEIRRLSPGFPVLFISGFDEIGPSDVPGLEDIQLLAKPFSAANLFAALRAAINARRPLA
ncbi:MAG: PAS domain S-box protein [Gemmatimonadaceae bacterium]|nr:PAS domain S-box protein [Gemmatimonadaceae bacterium]